MDNVRFLNLLGMCMRSGNMIYGQQTCIKAIKSGKAELVIINSAASIKIKDKIMNLCSSEQIPFYFFDSTLDFPSAIGKPTSNIVAITESNFKNKLIGIINSG